jgi:hypothetical protein
MIKWVKNLFREPVYEVLHDGVLETTENAIKLYDISGIAGIDTLVTEKLWKLTNGKFLQRCQVGSCKPDYYFIDVERAKGFIERRMEPRKAVEVISKI